MTDTILQPLFALFAWIGAVVIGAGTLGIVVYHVFKFLGEKWLTAKFGERLEAFKHAQQKELEELKFKINRLMDRTVKLHQREFDVLPEVWGRLSDAFKAAHPVSLGILEYADVNKMPAEQLEEFLAKTPLTGWQKSELKNASDKTRYYGDTMAWHELQSSQRRISRVSCLPVEEWDLHCRHYQEEVFGT